MIITGKCFQIRSETNCVHEIKLFLLMKYINVFDIGEKHAVLKYFAKSCAVLSLQRTAFIDWGKGVCLIDADSVDDLIM